MKSEQVRREIIAHNFTYQHRSFCYSIHLGFADASFVNSAILFTRQGEATLVYHVNRTLLQI